MSDKMLMLSLSALCSCTALMVHAADPLVVGDGEELWLRTSGAYSTITVNGRLMIDSGAEITADEVRVGWNGGSGQIDLVGAKLTATSVDVGSCEQGAANPVAGKGLLAVTAGSTLSGAVYLSRNCPKAGTAIATSPTNEVVIGTDSLIVGAIVKSCDPCARLAFDGGTLKSGPNMTLVSFNGLGNLYIDSVDGAPIHVDCGNVHSTFPNIPTQTTTGTVYIRGTGDFIREGNPTSPENPLHMAGYNIYQDDWSGFTGRIVVKDGGIRWFREKQADLADGSRAWRAENGGMIFIASGRQTISSFTTDGTGYISTKEAGGGTLVANLAGTETWDVRTPTINIRKLNVGELTLPKQRPNLVEVGEGTVNLTPPTGWKFYRFKVDKTNSGNTPYSSDKAMQISELKLYNGAENVTGKRIGCKAGNMTSTNNEGYDKAVDGSVDTKWCISDSTDNYWISLEYSGAQPVTHYEWYTANDATYAVGKTWREPMDWRFQGSMDGTTWYDLDSQKDFVATAERKTLAYTGTCAAVKPPASVATMVNALVSTGATLRINADYDFAPKSFYNYGTLELADGTVMQCGIDDADNEVVNPVIGGTADIVKTGAGTTTVLGVNPTTGKVKVESGTLRLGGAGTSAKYWRVTIKSIVGLDHLFQLGEVQLRALDGTYVNAGLVEVAPVTDATELSAGRCAFIKGYGFSNNDSERLSKLFDGNWSTKCCVPLRTSDGKPTAVDYNNPATWVKFVFRLSDDAKPAVCYQFVSGNDAKGLRNPNVWQIEASDDGETWTTLDDRSDSNTPMANCAIFNDGLVYPLKNCSGSVAAPVPNASDVTVAPGAELALVPQGTALNTLTIDCATGAGTVRGFSAARNGVLNLVNAESVQAVLEMTSLPITLADVGNTRLLRTWRVFVNGVETIYHPKMTAAGLVLCGPPMTLIVR